MIGAMDLSETARGLETAAKSQDRDCIDHNHEAMLAMYDRVLDVIKEMTGNTADTADAQEAEDDDEIIEFDPMQDEPEGGSI